MKVRLPRPASTLSWILASIFAASILFLLSTLFYRGTGGGLDFFMYIEGGKQVLSGEEGLYTKKYIYDMSYTNTPFSAVLFAPFALLDFGTSYTLFKNINIFIAVVSAAFIVKYLYDQKSFKEMILSPSIWGLALVLFGAISISGPWRESQQFGQVNILIFGLVLLDFALMASKKSRWTQGILVGVAAGIKVTPLAFGLYFVATRNWRGLIGMLGGFLGTVIIGFIALPKDAPLYWTKSLFDTSRVGEPDSYGNMSIRSALTHFLGSGTPTTLLWIILSLVMVVLTFFAAIGAARNKDLLGALAMTSLVMLLISPISWDHHWVWVAILFPTLFYGIWGLRPEQHALRNWGYLLLIFGIMIFLLNNRSIMSVLGGFNPSPASPFWGDWVKITSAAAIWGTGAIVWWTFRYWYPVQNSLQWVLMPGNESRRGKSVSATLSSSENLEHPESLPVAPSAPLPAKPPESLPVAPSAPLPAKPPESLAAEYTQLQESVKSKEEGTVDVREAAVATTTPGTADQKNEFEGDPNSLASIIARNDISNRRSRIGSRRHR